MTYFMARSNLVPYAFVWEKVKTMDFSETIYDIKVGRCSQQNEYMKLCVPKVRVMNWPCSKTLRGIFLSFFSSMTTDFNISSALRWAIQDQWPSGLFTGHTLLLKPTVWCELLKAVIPQINITPIFWETRYFSHWPVLRTPSQELVVPDPLQCPWMTLC